jgi:hypothetical protein
MKEKVFRCWDLVKAKEMIGDELYSTPWNRVMPYLGKTL